MTHGKSTPQPSFQLCTTPHDQCPSLEVIIRHFHHAVALLLLLLLLPLSATLLPVAHTHTHGTELWSLLFISCSLALSFAVYFFRNAAQTWH